MDRTDKHMTLADTADELTDVYQHVERIQFWDQNRNRKHRVHKVTMPGLLAQMAELFLPSGNPDGGSSAAVSKPPANWAALADHTVITLAAAKWCWDLRLEQRATVESNIRQLVGVAGNLDAETRARLTADMLRWHRIAETVTSWKTPPAPIRGAPCPALVEQPDGTVAECKAAALRISYDPPGAYCAICGTTWDQTAVRVLAEHVTTYNREARKRAAEARERDRAAKARLAEHIRQHADKETAA